MAGKEDPYLKRMEHYLTAAESESRSDPAQKYRAYNTDKTDLDLDEYSEAVRQPHKGGCLRRLLIMFVLLCLAAVVCWICGNGGLDLWK